MKIVFFGTSPFAIPCLEALFRSTYTPLLVVTQRDARGGRFRRLLESPVKRWALEKKIPLQQPESLSEISFAATLKRLSPDLFIVVSYGKILPSSLLTLPLEGGINVHPSLLPKYRGASPIPWAILNGDRKTGVSVIRLAEEVDAGEILLQKAIDIGEGEDAVGLTEQLSHMAGELLIKALEKIENGTVIPTPQKGKVSYAPRFKKEDGLMDWSKSAASLSRHIRALVPWPGSFSYLRKKRILFWKAKAEPGRGGRPGEIVDLSKGALWVAAGEGRLLLQELQLEGKERMSTQHFLIGHPLRLGETFSCNPVGS